MHVLGYCSENGITPEKRAVWKDNRNKGPPPAIGWKVGPGNPPDAGGWGGDRVEPYPAVPAPSYDAATHMQPVDMSERGRPIAIPIGEQTPPPHTRHHVRAHSNKKGSKSLPSSPVKNKTAGPWRPDPYEAPPRLYNAPMKRATSLHNTRSTNNSPSHDKNKKTRYHKGNVYVEVPDDGGPVEKETVL